ncbi:MAG: leucine-rich repeat protein, partial [Bacilli bacterium]|nr:leucine-rich repeat protein [Bacilli bacterium]
KNYFGDPQSNILSIPSVINNKQVVEIGEFAFSNIANKSKIDTVYIPTTVETIKQGAFYGCENINNIYFSTVSNVKYIHDSVFRNCISLLEIELPNSLIYLGDNCFYSCNNLNKITIDKNLSYLGSAAFAYCTIDDININNENSCYGFLNGILYDKNTNKLIYSNLETSSINIPSFITSISDYAFCGNNNISEIKFNNVEQIGDYAFINCANLEYIYNDDKVCRVNKNAFVGTKWFNNSDFELIVGSVLLKYSDNEETTYSVPTHIEYISDYAFHSKSLTEVIISETIELIGNSAFINCNNLKKVYLLDVYPPTIYSNSFPENENLVIYVPGLYVNNYKNHYLYTNYVENISSKWVSVKLMDEENLIQNIVLEYYSYLENIIVPEKEGFDFIGWYCNENQQTYNNGDIFDLYQSGKSLYAKYVPSKYKLYLNYNSDNENIDSTLAVYGEHIVYPISSKEGYNFIGWFDGPNNSYTQYSNENGESLRIWDKTEETVLYAVFEKKQFEIIYDLNGGKNSTHNPPYFYSDDMVLLDEPTKYGYLFDYWTLNGIKSNEIVSKTYENVYAEAHWKGVEINVSNSLENVYNNYYTYTTSNECEIIFLDSLVSSSNIVFIITPETKQITFISNDENLLFNACISISERTDNLVVNLNNIKFKAPNLMHAIDGSKGEYTLYLNCTGENELYGSDGIFIDGESLEEEKNGCFGISAYKLILNGGTILIKGGNGFDGIDGTPGSDGIDSEDNPDGWFFNPETGGDGTDGQNGTNGTAGGNGGFAIYTISTFAYSNCNATFIGGNGGRGGDGGKGGDGGDGASDESANIFNGVGDPGSGGDAGDGGDGGNSGVGALAVNSDPNLGSRGSDGIPGEGGSAGEIGVSGDPGANGKPGNDGEPGEVGTDAYLEVTLYKIVNCETTSENIDLNTEVQKSIIIELTVQCNGYYDIETLSVNGSYLKLYDDMKNTISIANSAITANENDVLIYPYLNIGKYYLEVISLGEDKSIKITFDSRITHSNNIYLNESKDVLSHIHKGIREYSFYCVSNGLYYIELNSTSQYGAMYVEGAIEIEYNGNIIQKFIIDDYDNEAVSIEHSNTMVFYAEKGKTYKIIIKFNDYRVDTLSLGIYDFEPIFAEDNTGYISEESMIYGDKFNLWNANESGKYKFIINYSGDCEDNIPFYVLRDDGYSITVINEPVVFSRFIKNREFVVDIEQGDVIYFGYLGGTKDGSIKVKFEKYIFATFELLTDVNGNVNVGSEVLINGGSYGGNVVTVGLTRICYLSSSAPDTTSRLNYEWNSSNEDIAIVSSYGTITAIRPGRVTITATFKNDKTIVGCIEIDVVPDYSNTIKRLKYGFDVREGGTTSGTEVTSGLGEKISITEDPCVSIHKGYTRLICLGEDSPNSSVQAFTWTAYREHNTDTGMVTVSQFGTITGTTSGWVTVKGVYKYNPNYEVYIRIYVE